MARPKPFDHANESNDNAPVLRPEGSRQAVVSGRVLMVLTTSLLLALIAFAIVYSTEIF